MAGRPRRVLVAVAVAVAALASLGVWWFVRADQRAIREVAARLLACSPERVDVLSSETSDTAELYRVRACGRDATLICSAPDFECAVEPDGAPPR